ncbi:MAG: galactose mutarotase [Verrucomicrobia bacterium]|nr:galactose mutarotase [Verrucomicrobiota bacterium]MDA1068168.1 galactose mutarotase [Verrucomicrobiota bacterium]
MNYFKLSNRNGIEIDISPYGGIIQSLKVPDRYGQQADITLGFDTVAEYQAGSPFFGALVGRYCNRIAGGRFKLDQTFYPLAINNGKNHLHGGVVGFDKVNWVVEETMDGDAPALKLNYTSADGDEGYPGELKIEVMYSLNDTDDFTISYRATTDKSTHVNMTQHAYFNLAGHDAGSIVDHDIWVNADFFTPTDGGSIPTGEIRPVDDTAFDFRKVKRIEDAIYTNEEQINFCGGIDINFVLNKLPYDLSHASTAVHRVSGRTMDVFTTEPGLQFYTGNNLNGINGKGGAFYKKHDGFCFESQHFPDTPNKSMFPSTRLDPGQEYNSCTVYKFGLADS